MDQEGEISKNHLNLLGKIWFILSSKAYFMPSLRLVQMETDITEGQLAMCHCEIHQEDPRDSRDMIGQLCRDGVEDPKSLEVKKIKA